MRVSRRASERWRSLDRAGFAGRQTAECLFLLGDVEAAWDYLTTSSSVEAENVEEWKQTATMLQRERQFALADLAIEAAPALEPRDAAMVWERAQNWVLGGRPDLAEPYLRALIDGKWEERYREYPLRAKLQLGER